METYTTHLSSPVGWLQITCRDNALISVIFKDEKGIENDSHPLLDKCIEQLDEYFSGSRREFELELDQPCTMFQSRVWALLQEIPYGKTISYNVLAKKYGDVKAIRACASANGKNNLAIIVPCHRVIGSDQSLVGYAGGLPRKKWLLAHEAKNSGVMQLF